MGVLSKTAIMFKKPDHLMIITDHVKPYRVCNACNVTPFNQTGVDIMTLNAAIQCTPTFHHLLHATTEIFHNPKTSPVMLCPTRESNPRPLIRQSHLRLLDQQGNLIELFQYSKIYI
ncbi:hypothetical protein SFRURICE_013306 [Spodoptera frugiperda]|nr:hypothetical protein SFRURICE_013306 [Spodoptera frugiperda]